jgi:16S rRNA (cytosine967-C5)-methyltransferase
MLQNLSNLQCLVLDGLKVLPFRRDSFDRVLVDAPCTGTGTLRRNPEIRWRITADDIEDLSARQQQLLQNAASVVKPGGRLVYSTCSVEPEENELVAQRFLENNHNFSVASETLLGPIMISGTARTWPQRDGCDGFFVAAFEQNAR